MMEFYTNKLTKVMRLLWGIKSFKLKFVNYQQNGKLDNDTSLSNFLF